MKKKILSLILGLSLVGTLLTGCGSAASASAAPAPAAEEAKEEAEPAPEAKADDAAEAGAEDEADQAGDVTVLEVALEANNAPYTYEDEDGNPAGYEYEVLKLIDEKLPQYEFNYTVIDYETAAAGVNTGKYAFESGCKFRTPAREEAFLVSDPYNYFFMNLVVKDDSGIEGLEDLSGKSIASIVGTDGRAVALNDWLKAHPDVDIQFEELAAAGAMADEIQGVEDGVFDAAYLSAEQAQAIFDESDYSDLKITDRVDGRDTVFLINKDSKDVQEALNSALKTLTDEGTLGSLTKEFFGEDNFEVAEKLGLKK